MKNEISRRKKIKCGQEPGCVFVDSRVSIIDPTRYVNLIRPDMI
jgi:hypothetical protein